MQLRAGDQRKKEMLLERLGDSATCHVPLCVGLPQRSPEEDWVGLLSRGPPRPGAGLRMSSPKRDARSGLCHLGPAGLLGRELFGVGEDLGAGGCLEASRLSWMVLPSH